VNAGLYVSALRRARPRIEPGPFPSGSVLLVGAAAGVLSVAGLVADLRVAAAGLLVAVVLLVAFVVHERRSDAGILPAATFRPGSPLRWIYGVSAALVGLSSIEVFVPLFGQRIAGLTPVWAGFLGVALGAGWVSGEVISASARRPRGRVQLGPGLLAAGLVVVTLALVTTSGAWTTALWVVGLVAGGVGIGTAWPHLAAAAIGGADAPGPDARPDGPADARPDGTPTAPPDDEAASREGDKASAAVTTVQMLATALGAALGGALITLGGPEPLGSARWLSGAFAVLAVAGALAARPASRGAPARV
jgi:hypothetical protein